ncbi:MAG TPA: hypothetical protein VK186_22145, partial [Candidatus Deferrimicrobium sp.]|nr:hypothetical protein [Candidatus Deferrimicrobium sp.]
MSVLVFFILAFFAIILFSFISAIRLLNKNSVLQAKLQKLESRLLKVENELFKSAAAGLKQSAGEEKPATAPVEAKAIPVPGIFPIEPSTPKARTGKPEYWGRIEKQFMDNWTGILGSVIMVMGAAFLSVYAALKLAPFYRFLMLCAFSGALFSIYWALRAKAKWL